MLQNKWRMMTLAAVAVVGLCLGLVPGAARAAEKKAETAVVKESPDEKAMQDLAMAYRLINYGREKKQPEALALAVRILSTTKGKLVKQADAGKDAPEGEKLEKVLDANLKQLLNEAEKMAESGSVKSLVKAQKALIEQTRTDLGDQQRSIAVNGVQSYAASFPAGASGPLVFNHLFASSKAASVTITVLTAADSGHLLRAALSNGANVVALDTRNSMTLTYLVPKSPTGTTALTVTVVNVGNASQPVVFLVTNNALK